MSEKDDERRKTIYEQEERLRKRMADVEHKIVVISGKGGFGRFLTTVDLTVASPGMAILIQQAYLTSARRPWSMRSENARYERTTDSALEHEWIRLPKWGTETEIFNAGGGKTLSAT